MQPFTRQTYQDVYQASLENPEAFWAQHAQTELAWSEPWQDVFTVTADSYSWFLGGTLNVSYNCLDRHVLAGHGERLAYRWLSESGEEQTITYQELLEQVSHAAAGLQALGVNKGDRVVLYMPVCIPAIVIMLACTRIGAVHSVVFAGFSATALATRVAALQPKVVVTAEHTWRRGNAIDLVAIVEEALATNPETPTVVVWERGKPVTAPHVSFASLVAHPEAAPALACGAEDPLFVLYTSGTTGHPKGIVHTTAGYLLGAHLTTRYVFQPQANELYWCTADIGWITGHSYLVYGPLSNGMTSLITEGAPDSPRPDWWWELIAKYSVNVLYTAPTTIRMFMRLGEELPGRHDLSSLRLLGSVGEPLNPEAWEWYHRVIGRGQAEIVDTWWQTETGSHVLVTLPTIAQKKGKAGLPFFGVQPEIVDDAGQLVAAGTVGNLRLRSPWPSALRTCWNDHARFLQYWSEFPHGFITGDRAVQDDEGYVQILGRTDDVMNSAGHRISSAELENALIRHPAVAESAVVAKPDELRGEVPHAFVVLRSTFTPSTNLEEELQALITQEVGKFARCQGFTFVTLLPKTRSGKIMRRVLRAELTGQELGDTSTLESTYVGTTPQAD